MNTYELTIKLPNKDAFMNLIDNLGPFTGSMAVTVTEDKIEPRGAPEFIHALHPKPPAKTRAKKSNGDWPPPNSTYAIVLEALQGGAILSNRDLRDVLVGREFSPGSINSVIGRLEKSGKITKTEGGFWALAA
jgi:hypothetical protein